MAAEYAIPLVAAPPGGDERGLGHHPHGAATAHQQAVGQRLALTVLPHCTHNGRTQFNIEQQEDTIHYFKQREDTIQY